MIACERERGNRKREIKDRAKERKKALFEPEWSVRRGKMVRSRPSPSPSFSLSFAPALSRAPPVDSVGLFVAFPLSHSARSLT